MKQRRILWIAAIAWVLSATCATAAQKAGQALRDYAEETAGRQAYGLYFQNQKAGWMIYESKIETRGEGAAKKEILASRLQMVISLGRAGQGLSLKNNQASFYELSGKGAMLYSELISEENGKVTKHTARPQAGKFLIVTQRNQRETGRRTTTTQDTVAEAVKFYDWITSKPQPGAQIQTSMLDLERGRDTISDFIYENATTISWGGVPTEIYTVKMKSDGVAVAMDVKANGWPIRARIAGAFDLRAEEEKIAKALSAEPFDMLSASLIKTNKSLGEAKDVDTLKIEVSGLSDFDMPVSHRQKIVSRDAASVVLEMQRDYKVASAASLPAAQRAEYLKATPAYPTSSPVLKNLVKRIAGSERDPVKIATLLQNWVYRSLRKTMAANAATAAEVLEARAGDCTEHTVLFVALARTAGLPAREVGGIMYAGEETPMFGWHAWAQIHDGHQWVSVDPTWDQVYVDATHIEFSYGDEDWAWVNVLGTVKLNVLAFQRG